MKDKIVVLGPGLGLGVQIFVKVAAGNYPVPEMGNSATHY